MDQTLQERHLSGGDIRNQRLLWRFIGLSGGRWQTGGSGRGRAISQNQALGGISFESIPYILKIYMVGLLHA